MYKVICFIMLAGILAFSGSTLTGCDGGVGSDSAGNDYDTDGIEECETNGLCGGCCSHHGGVACRNGVTVCWDGSPLSDTCFNKGCDGCISCPSEDPCWGLNPGDSCGEGKVCDCGYEYQTGTYPGGFECINKDDAESAIGNGTCDRYGEQGAYNLLCPEFNLDGGDCDQP